MYRNITLKQIAIELKLLNDSILNRFIEGRGRGGDEPFIKWSVPTNQTQVSSIVDMLIRRKLGVESHPSAAPPLSPETTILNLLVFRECLGNPTKTAADFLEESIGVSSSDSLGFAQAADAVFAAPRRLHREYIPVDEGVQATRKRIEAVAALTNSSHPNHRKFIPKPASPIPNYKMAPPTPSTNVPVLQEAVPQAIAAFIANVRNFYQRDLGKSEVPLAEKASFLLSNSKCPLTPAGPLPRDVGLLVGEYLTGIERKPEPSLVSSSSRSSSSSSSSSSSTEIGFKRFSSSAPLPQTIIEVINKYKGTIGINSEGNYYANFGSLLESAKAAKDLKLTSWEGYALSKGLDGFLDLTNLRKIDRATPSFADNSSVFFGSASTIKPTTEATLDTIKNLI